jgi:CRP-like cAMP-binding protein
VANGLVAVSVDAGETLMRQGEPGDRFIVIDSGEVEVAVDGRFVQRVGRGAGVGEIALLRHSARTATVTAVTDIAGLSVDAGTFLAAVSGPAAAAVTERIAGANLRRGTAPRSVAAAG